jgi:hypothetical protein
MDPVIGMLTPGDVGRNSLDAAGVTFTVQNKMRVEHRRVVSRRYQPDRATIDMAKAVNRRGCTKRPDAGTLRSTRVFVAGLLTTSVPPDSRDAASPAAATTAAQTGLSCSAPLHAHVPLITRLKSATRRSALTEAGLAPAGEERPDKNAPASASSRRTIG